MNRGGVSVVQKALPILNTLNEEGVQTGRGANGTNNGVRFFYLFHFINDFHIVTTAYMSRGNTVQNGYK